MAGPKRVFQQLAESLSNAMPGRRSRLCFIEPVLVAAPDHYVCPIKVSSHRTDELLRTYILRTILGPQVIPQRGLKSVLTQVDFQALSRNRGRRVRDFFDVARFELETTHGLEIILFVC